MSALLQFGGFTFEMRGLAPFAFLHRREWRWGEVQRLSGEQALQYLGRGPAEFTADAVLFPERYRDHSTASIDALEAIGDAGAPQPLVRGDLTMVGWYSLVGLETGSSYLDRRGRGRMVEVSIAWSRFGSDGPGTSDGAGGAIGSALSFFGL